MQMPYDMVECPKVRDFIEMAKNGMNFFQLIDSLVNIISAVITIVGLIAIIITFHPVILVFIILVAATKIVTDAKSRRLTEKWKGLYTPAIRKNSYLYTLMRSPNFSKEIRTNDLKDWCYSKCDDNIQEIYDLEFENNKELQKNDIWPVVATILQEAAVYIMLGYQVLFKGMLIGDFSMYLTSISSFSNSLSNIISSVSQLLKSGILARDFRYCIETAEKNLKSAQQLDTHIDKKTSIILRLNMFILSIQIPRTLY